MILHTVTQITNRIRNLRANATQWIVLAGCLSYAQVQAQTSENPSGDNFRERCRKVVSGAFANSYHEANRARDAVKLAEGGIKRLTPLAAKANQDLVKIEKKIKASEFDPALIERRDQYIAQIKLYHEQLQTLEGQAEDAKKAASISDRTYKEINGDVRALFQVAFTDDPDGLPQKIFHQLTWKSPCPKFRTLCPLPAAEVTVLKSLTTKISDGDGDCKKYAALK